MFKFFRHFKFCKLFRHLFTQIRINKLTISCILCLCFLVVMNYFYQSHAVYYTTYFSCSLYVCLVTLFLNAVKVRLSCSCLGLVLVSVLSWSRSCLGLWPGLDWDWCRDLQADTYRKDVEIQSNIRKNFSFFNCAMEQ